MLDRPEWLYRELEFRKNESEHLYTESGTTREIYLRSMAHHEAGHAVLAVALGFRITRHGGVRINTTGGSSDIRLHYGMPELSAIVMYAGYYASKRYDPTRDPSGCEGSKIGPYIDGDFERARKYCPADSLYHEQLKALTQVAVERRWAVISDFAFTLLNRGPLEKEFIEQFIRERLQLLAWPILPSVDQILQGGEPGAWYFLAV